jgi:hypothetical protein
MIMTLDITELRVFIVQAKRCTYAADAAAVLPPLVPGSKQLEYHKESWFYRDIYFGEQHFVGQETVYFKGTPVWSMVYSGGILRWAEDDHSPDRVYGFLQAALREISAEQPYRGPQTFGQGVYTYTNENDGNLERFSGLETINFQEYPIYSLHYSGGRLK